MSTRSVLIVDDEKNIRLTLAESLSSIVQDIETAINGEEALEKLARKDFALVLLDIHMPGMDGMEVLRRLRETRPGIRVIMITAHGTVDTAVEAMKLGAVDFLQKPFTPADIRALAGRALDREHLDEERAQGFHQHIELARKCFNERRFDAAGEFLRRAIADDPSRPEPFNLLGVLLELKGDKIEAQKNYRAALALDPTYTPADANLNRVVGITPFEKIALEKAGAEKKERR
jgi:DNA-binding response OmpR family regulator